MKKGLIGRKLGLTQVFAEDGAAVPVTVIEVEPSVIVQKKTKQRMAMTAPTRIRQNQAKKASRNPCRGISARLTRGISGSSARFNPTAWKRWPWDRNCEWNSLRRRLCRCDGNLQRQGVCRRRQKGMVSGEEGRPTGPCSTGAPGSIGASAYPSRVFKGKKLPGQMGNEPGDRAEPSHFGRQTGRERHACARGCPRRSTRCCARQAGRQKVAMDQRIWKS